MADDGKPGGFAKCLLIAIVLLALVTLGTIFYGIGKRPAPVRGAAGPLSQNSPNHDPPD